MLMTLNGNDFWPSPVLRGLKPHKFGDRILDYYEDTPVSLYESLRENAAQYPDKICIVDDYEQTYTSRQFLDLVDRFSAVLFRQYHVNPGSHVALLLYNSIEFCTAFFALLKLQSIVIPLPTKYRKDEIFSLIEKADLNGMICDSTFTGWFQQRFEVVPYFIISVNGNTSSYRLPQPGSGD